MLYSGYGTLRMILILAVLVLTESNAHGKRVRVCSNPGTPKRGYRIGDKFKVGATVEYFCNPGFRIVSGSRLRTCHTNVKWTGSLPKCADINECVEYSDVTSAVLYNDVQGGGGSFCHPHARCHNSIGSYMCKCNAGFHGDGRECSPTNLYGIVESAMRRKLKPSPRACGTIIHANSSRVRRIVGGTFSTQGAWPWQAHISYKNGGKRFPFNGALIKTRWVLTVANAVIRGGRPVKPRKLLVTLGKCRRITTMELTQPGFFSNPGDFNTQKADGSEQTFRVRRIVTHPRYGGYLSNNIALLELDRPVSPDNYVRMICLPRRRRDAKLENPPNYGTVVGWGTTRRVRIGHQPGSMSAKLRQVTVPIVSNKECKRATIYNGYNTADTFCAGFKRRPKDPCFGDVGSPLVMQNPRNGRWVVVGLYGWSEGCGQPRKYSYYTRVSKYRRWIQSVVRKRRN